KARKNVPPGGETGPDECGCGRVNLREAAGGGLSAPRKVMSAASRRACPGGRDGGDKPRRSPDKPRRSPDKPRRSPDKPRRSPHLPPLGPESRCEGGPPVPPAGGRPPESVSDCQVKRIILSP